MEGLVSVLQHGQGVGEHLSGVELVGQAVEDGDASVLGQLLHDGLVESAVLDAVIHASQHSGSVLHGLLVTDVGSARAEVRHMRTLIMGRHLERTPSPRRRLLEDQSDVLPLEHGLLGPGVFGLFELRSESDKEFDLFGAVMCQRQQMTTLQIECHDNPSFPKLV